jgi:4-carboxymuconolactone decarboxylase
MMHGRRAGVVMSRPDMDFRTILRRLSVRDDSFVDHVMASNAECATAGGLACKTYALVRIGALVALDAGTPSYLSAVESARAAGATEDEIVGALLAVMPVVGAPRVVSAAPRLGLALDYDVPEALEALDPALVGP